VDHTHNTLYASKASEHVHWNEEALENITNERIQSWDNHVIETISELVELRTELHNLEDDMSEDIRNRHTHTNLDVLNKILEKDIDRWDAMNIFNTENKLTTASVGGVSEGADLSGLTIQQILKRILFPDKKWEITASLVLDKSGSVFEKGTTVTVKQIKVTTVEQGSNPIKEIAFYVNGKVVGTLTNPDSSAGTFVYDVNIALTDSVNNSYFRIQLKDSAEVIIKANTKVVVPGTICFVSTEHIAKVGKDHVTIKDGAKLLTEEVFDTENGSDGAGSDGAIGEDELVSGDGNIIFDFGEGTDTESSQYSEVLTYIIYK
jgi:hypothetical protein